MKEEGRVEMSVRKVSRDELFVSTPPPEWFGNGSNVSDSKWTAENWLTSRFHFAFAEYRNPQNSRFGVLRVCNDDLVQPARGFGTHPHANMEICTYIVDGELTHEHQGSGSSARESLPRGSVQYMSAGTGVHHSEQNASKDHPCRFLQLWIVPRRNGLPVQYGGLKGDFEGRKNRWQHLVQDIQSQHKTAAPIQINQDCNIYVSEFDRPLEFKLSSERQIYLVNIEGNANLSYNGESVPLQQHDAAEIKGPGTMGLTPSDMQGSQRSHVLVVEMAKDSSSRFA